MSSMLGNLLQGKPVEQQKQELETISNMTIISTAKPDRTIPFDETTDSMDEEHIQRWNEAREFLLQGLGHKENISQAARLVLNLLKSDANYIKLLKPEDAGLISRALRQSYGAIFQNKSERKTKRAASKEKFEESKADFMQSFGNAFIQAQKGKE